MDLQQAFDEGFDALKGYVDRSFDAYAKRLEALESALPKKSEKGDPGKDGRPGADGKDGRDGKDAEVTPEMIVAAVRAVPDVILSAVAEHLRANPPAAGKDGIDGRDGLDGKDGAPGANGKDGADGINGKDGIDGRDGLDGCGVKELLIDRDGCLVATLDDGRVNKLGVVVGRNGAPGRDGKDGAEGIAGKDGADGVGFDDLDMEVREDGVFFTFTKGDIVKEARIPVIIDCGVWKEGRTYHKGNGVSWGGQFWICQTETADKPDTSNGWRLAVKKGRDGKDKP